MLRIQAWWWRVINKPWLSATGPGWYRRSMSERIFAYGSNMCLGRLREYDVHPKKQGLPGQLLAHALRFNKKSTKDGSGKANVEPSDGAAVWGVIYEITNEELERLNEGEIGYSPKRMPVLGSSGQVDAWVHVADKPDKDAALRPYSWYKRFLVEGARFHGLPPEYVAKLEAIDTSDDQNLVRDRLRRSIGCGDATPMPELLSAIVRRWKADFKGISALEIADMFEIPHGEAMTQLRALKDQGSIVLRECHLGQAVKFNEISMGDASVKIPIKFEMVDTLMAFPNRDILREAFHADRADYGVFTNRLHLGDSQVQHYYFKRDVLDKYLRHRDRYDVTDDATGGDVSMTTEYYQSLSEAGQESDGFATIRFGNMKLVDGTEAIGVIAKDLDYLSKQEQHHWAAHEIAKPVLSDDDKSWSDYISEQFEGNWDADHTDYVKMLTDVMNRINEGAGPLFSKTEHPGLHVPVLNTVVEYASAHKELYKLVGADNLIQDTLRELLLANGCREDEFVNDGGRPKGKWALLKMLAERKGLDWSVLDVVATNRQQDSHRIQAPPAGDDYYPRRFREDLKKLVVELQKLA